MRNRTYRKLTVNGVRLFGVIGAVTMVLLTGNVAVMNLLEPETSLRSGTTIVDPATYPVRFQQAIQYTGITPTYQVAEDLSIGIGLNLPAPAGYVNVINPTDVVWVKYERTANGLENTYIYTHEYAHVLQKHVIANMNNKVYPSTWNLTSSYGFYLKTLQLNDTLNQYQVEQFMKPEYMNTVERLSGLEANADCVAEWFGIPPISFSYIETPCSLQSLAAAYLIIHSIYPDPDAVTRYALLIEKGYLEKPFVALPAPD